MKDESLGFRKDLLEQALKIIKPKIRGKIKD
jgi:hypothetical protein